MAETFGDLDPEIDAREGDVPKKEWGGFHYLEQKLWVDGTTDGLTSYTKALNDDVATLQNLVKDVELQPGAIANGAVELLNEVSASKITGEEERYSHTDLVDFEANVQGAQAAFEAVKPILETKDPDLAADVEAKFAAVTAALAPYRTGTTFVAYTALDQRRHQGTGAGDRRPRRAALEGGQGGREFVTSRSVSRRSFLGTAGAGALTAATVALGADALAESPLRRRGRSERLRGRRPVRGRAPGGHRHTGPGPAPLRLVRRRLGRAAPISCSS